MMQITELDGGVSGYIESLRRERDRFVAFAFCAADLLIEIDAKRAIKFIAGATQSLVASGPEQLTGKPLADLIAPQDRLLIGELLRALAPGNRLDPVLLRLNGRDGPTAPLSVTGYHVPDMPGCFFLAMRLGANPITRNDELARDADSGLLEAAPFAELASERIQESEQRGESLKLTFLRTENLSALCDRLDREAEKSLNRTLGACLQAYSVGGGAAGRFEDDSFGLVHKAGVDVAEIRDRIMSMLRDADPQNIGVAVTSGTIDAAPKGMNKDEAAKVLLYTVNRFCATDGPALDIASLSENLTELTRESTEKLVYFRDMTATGNFDVAFQPIVAMGSREIYHFEALARFGGDVRESPYHLITFAEDTGLILDFDLAMCRRVLSWLKTNNAAGARCVVAVNLSGHSIGNTAFVAALHQLLQEHDGLRPQIMFEITESARIHDLNMANRFIQGLRNAGHQVCLDDFGAGAAALNYLHALEVDVVKIDGQYIRSAMDKPRNRAFLKAVVGLCRDLGIGTVAEMVEDEACAKMLVECGVKYGQGYLFGRPTLNLGVKEIARPGLGEGAPRPRPRPARAEQQGPLASSVKPRPLTTAARNRPG